MPRKKPKSKGYVRCEVDVTNTNTVLLINCVVGRGGVSNPVSSCITITTTQQAFNSLLPQPSVHKILNI